MIITHLNLLYYNHTFSKKTPTIPGENAPSSWNLVDTSALMDCLTT